MGLCVAGSVSVAMLRKLGSLRQIFFIHLYEFQIFRIISAQVFISTFFFVAVSLNDQCSSSPTVLDSGISDDNLGMISLFEEF